MSEGVPVVHAARSVNHRGIEVGAAASDRDGRFDRGRSIQPSERGPTKEARVPFVAMRYAYFYQVTVGVAGSSVSLSKSRTVALFGLVRGPLLG